VLAPQSAYILFIKDIKSKIVSGEVQLTDKKNFLQEASALWQGLSEAE
jgi:hypothetical protein